MDKENDKPKLMPLKETPEGQNETRAEHICSQKHNIGHNELELVQRQDGDVESQHWEADVLKPKRTKCHIYLFNPTSSLHAALAGRGRKLWRK